MTNKMTFSVAVCSKDFFLRFGLLLLLFSYYVQEASAQAPTIQWQKEIGTDAAENGNAINQTTDGGYIVAGKQNGDFFVAKLTATGTTQWTKTIADPEFGGGYTVQQTKDGGYILGGGYSSLKMIKLDAAGTKQWETALGGLGQEAAISIQQTTDGGYIAAGSSTSSNGGIAGNGSSSLTDAIVVKLNASGVVQWQKYYGTTDFDDIKSIQQTADGGFIMAGSTHKDSFADEQYQAWVVKLTTTGTVQWQKTLGGNGTDFATAIRQTTDGGYIMAANTNLSNSGDVSGTLQGETDFWIVKLNATGAITWQKLLGGDSGDIPSAIQQTTDGGFIVVGNTRSSNTGDVGNNINSPTWVVKLNSTGVLQGQKLLTGSITGLDRTIQQTSDKGYIIVGTIDGAGNAQGNIWVTKLNATCNTVVSISGSSVVNVGSKITLTGSPTTGTVTWTSSNPSVATVSSTGVVTGVAYGFDVTITYKVTEGSCTAEASKLIRVEGNSRPVFESFFVDKAGYSPYTTQLSVVAVDPDLDPLTYEWDFGDGSPKGTTPTVNHTFTTLLPSQTFIVTVKVSDNKGLSATGSFNVVVDYVGQLGCLKYAYYNNTTLSGTPAQVVAASEIAFSAPNIDPKRPKINNISIRWDGSIIPSVSGIYTFTVRADDGVQLFINNQLIIDKWLNQLSTRVYTATVYLTKGKWTPIKVKYYQNTGPAELSLNWTVPNGTSKRMPFKACPLGTTALSTTQIYAASGYKQGQKAVINWVSNAQNADYFTVEKLDKDGNFAVLDKVNAQQNSSNLENKYYSFTDKQIIDGENTYRVTLYADNTPPQYSDLISLNFKSFGDFSLSPNPTNDYLDVDLSLSENQRVTLTVVDAWGREVQALTLDKVGKTQRIDVNNLPTGLYLLHIRTQGKRDVTRLFTVTK
jgi:PA14 domain/Secretion system C-terminal sorting domain/PKD domain/Bacterial Ig-like domain (group 2)